MDACQFLYIGRDDLLPKCVLGIERSWEELKVEFDRVGSGCPGAIYFKTISLEGPHLFAVVNNNSVFYHEEGHWYRYQTAIDIKFGVLNSKNPSPTRIQANMSGMNNKEWTIMPRDKEINFDKYCNNN